jgi:hypothetical protein
MAKTYRSDAHQGGGEGHAGGERPPPLELLAWVAVALFVVGLSLAAGHW